MCFEVDGYNGINVSPSTLSMTCDWCLYYTGRSILRQDALVHGKTSYSVSLIKRNLPISEILLVSNAGH